MAFRSQEAIGTFLVLICCGSFAAAADPVTIPVRHHHMRKGGLGQITIGEASISFREDGKKPQHSRVWAYDEIQQLFIGSDSLKILTYEDVVWSLRGDREYVFDKLPEKAALLILDTVKGRVDERRLVAAIPDLQSRPVWQVKAKRLEGRGGSEGTVLIGEDSIVYMSEERDASRTWHLRQLDNISTSGPFDLTVTTFEQGGSRFGGRRDFRFQLKTELNEDRYNALWRRLNESRLTKSLLNTDSMEKPDE